MLDAALALGHSIQSAAGRPVIYQGVRDGAAFAIELSATVGSTAYPAVAGEGQVVEQFVSRDFIFTAAELVLGGAELEPRAHDTISETAASGQVLTWRVMPPSLGDRPYRYCDTTRSRIRVHTKQRPS